MTVWKHSHTPRTPRTPTNYAQARHAERRSISPAGRPICINRRAFLGATAATGLAFATRDQSLDAQETHSWRAGVPIPHARSELAAAVIAGAIYVCGGLYEGERVDRFDLATQQWAEVTHLPTGVHHPGVAALDGVVYVAGGYVLDNHVATANVWSYDPVREFWEARANLPEAKGAFGLVAIDGFLYAAGGAYDHLGGAVSGDTLRYDPVTDTWDVLAAMPTPREHLAVVATGGRIYTVGGRANGDEREEFASAVESYDPATDVWSSLAPLPVPRGGLTGTATGGAIVVLGGERGSTTYADANRYNPATDSWTALPPLPTARHGLASAYVDGELYAITGSTLAGGIDNTPAVEVLRLESVPGATPTG